MTIPRQHTCKKCAWSYAIMEDPSQPDYMRCIAANGLSLSCAWSNLWQGIAFTVGVPRFVDWLSKAIRKRSI